MKSKILTMQVFFVRFYLQFFPFDFGKLFLWKRVHKIRKVKTVKVKQGFKLKLRTNDLVQGYLFYFGFWELPLSNYLSSVFKTEDSRTFIDIGANVGYFSLLVAKINPKVKIVAIEAFPSIYQKLEKNIKLNNFSNIRAINYAVSDCKKELIFQLASKDNIGATTSKIKKIKKKDKEACPLTD